MKTKLFLVLILSLITIEIQAQKGQQTLHLEAFGRGFLFGSLNYEYHVHNRVALGGGLGLAHIGVGEITRNVNGTPETGRYFDMASTQMLYGTYFIGKKSHKMLLTAGLTHFGALYRNTYPTSNEVTIESQIQPCAGVGYQYERNRWSGRLTAYYMAMPQPAGWFPDYMPWLGASVGYRLR